MGHLQVAIYFPGTVIQDVWGVFRVLGVGWGKGGGDISFVSIVGTMGIGGITSGLPLVFFVHESRIETHFDTCTKKTNDNPLVIALGHGTHY